MALRYNPPPGWPPPPPGFSPQPGWQPDPSWPPPPPGWQLWVDDREPAAPPFAAGPAPGWAGEPAPGGGRAYRGSRAGGTSAWAVVSFVLGIVAIIPVSVVAGIVALRRIRRLGQGGTGLAIAGLVLSAVWLVVFVAAGVLSNGTATRQDTTGRITHRGNLGVFALAAGDCFDNPTSQSNIESVTAIPCTQAHDSQVFAKFTVTGSDSAYPGQAALNKTADRGCNARTGTIDRAKATSAMTIRVLFPERDAWAGGERTVSCLIVNPTPTLRSSLVTS